MQSIEKRQKQRRQKKGIAKEGENKRDGFGLQFSSGKGERKKEAGFLMGQLLGQACQRRKRKGFNLLGEW